MKNENLIFLKAARLLRQGVEWPSIYEAVGKDSASLTDAERTSFEQSVRRMAESLDGPAGKALRKALHSRLRSPKPTAEIVPASEAALVPPGPRQDLEAMITRIVRERVDELMVKVEGRQVEPDFLPKDVSVELQERRNVFERRKWSLYFEKWGCRMCSRKNVSHAATGHCARCHNLVAGRLALIKAEYERNNPETEIDRQIDRLTSRFRVAKSLLGRCEE